MRSWEEEDGKLIFDGLKWVLFVLLILLAMWWAVSAPKAHALPISYSFAGVMGDGGTITGTFSYDTAAAAIATNVRSLSPNSQWALTSAFTIAPIYQGLPSWQASVSEFCTGKCIFSANPSTTFLLSNANSSVRLGWEGATPFGAFWWQASELRTLMPTGKTSTIMVTSGTLTQHSVPLPGTLWTFGLGLGGLLIFHRWTGGTYV
jgi:hypothetical protein